MKHWLAAMVMALSGGLAHADLVYVGSQGQQLRALRFDAASGKLEVIGTVAEGLRPTWTVAHPQLPVLYAVDDQPGQDGAVVAFAINHASGALSRLNTAPSGGAGVTYLWLDAPSATLLAANFGGGSASSIAVQEDGSLGALVSTIKASGSGPHRRQAGPHAHSVAVDSSGRYALVPDLGADRVFIYALDRATHALTTLPPAVPRPAQHAPPSPPAGEATRAYAAPPGSGPRHLVFSADGRSAWLLNELTAEVTTLRWDAQQATLSPVQTLVTSSAEFTGTRSGAEIVRSPDGRFIYVEDRGERTLVTYRVNPANGELSFVQRIASGGEMPWSMAIHPSGRWLLVAHQRSGTVNVFSIDPASGLLTNTGIAAEAPTAVSITFVPPSPAE
jgi:6-phosphogluconolactonase